MKNRLISKTINTASCVLLLSSPVQAQDWTGFYFGGQGSIAGIETIHTFGNPVPIYGGTADVGFGFFGGYRHELESGVVIGGEIVYTIAEPSSFAGNSYGTKNIWELRGRVGYARGNVMPYFAAGAAAATSFTASQQFGTGTGYSVAVGVEFKASSKVSIRTEYVRAFFDDVLGNSMHTLSTDALNVGIAWQF